MRLWDKIEIIDPYPAVYLPEVDVLAIADLHLGYEGIMAEQGVFIPKVQFEKEMHVLKEILGKREAKRIVICGDVKHEFSETSYHEFVEVNELFKFLKENFEETFVVKGNHDNYLTRVTRRYGIALNDFLKIGQFFFMHGHILPKDFRKTRLGYIIMGHEHPAIVLYDEVGSKEKLNCFLYGQINGGGILVLPAFSTLAEGSQVNAIPREDLLSPILRGHVDVDSLKVIAISPEVGLLEFPELRKIRV
jgi:putative SbcD/Mre11-related phosphoesterase